MEIFTMKRLFISVGVALSMLGFQSMPASAETLSDLFPKCYQSSGGFVDLDENGDCQKLKNFLIELEQTRYLSNALDLPIPPRPANSGDIYTRDNARIQPDIPAKLLTPELRLQAAQQTLRQIELAADSLRQEIGHLKATK